MHNYAAVALLAAMCLLQAPGCDCAINIQSLFQEKPTHDVNSNNPKSLLDELPQALPDRNTNPFGDQKKDILNRFSGGNPFELITSGSNPSEQEITLKEVIEKPEKGSGIPNTKSQPFQGLKLSDVFGLKSVLDNLQDRISSSRFRQEHTATDRTDNTDLKNALEEALQNKKSNSNDISIIVVEEQHTTTTPPPPPIITIDTEVITTKDNFEKCLKNKDCDLFNIRRLLSKILNSNPSQFGTAQEPATEEPHVDESPLFPVLNFDKIFRNTLFTTAAPVVEGDTEVITNKNIFSGCGKQNGDSQRSCGLDLLNISGLLLNILKNKPIENAHQSGTVVPKTNAVDSQRIPFLNIPIQISKALPTFDFQKLLPAVAKIFPEVHKSQNEQKQTGNSPISFIEQYLNSVSGKSAEHQEDGNEQKKPGNKPSAFISKSLEEMKSLLENFNLLK